jgi:DNA-binding IclR family transcriptional regulator
MDKSAARRKQNAASHAHLSVQKAFRILELLAARSPQGVTEIAHGLGLEKSSVSRLLRSLSQLGYVVQSSIRGKYRGSARLLTLAQQYGSGDRLSQEAAPVLRLLARDAQASAHLAVLVDRSAVVIAKESSPNLIQVASSVGGRLPLHASALGKVLLAGLGEEERQAFLVRPLRRFTDKTITDPRKLRRILEDVRRSGLAFEAEEEHPGVGCIGAPVCDAQGRWIAAMSIAGPVQGTAFRLDPVHAALVASRAAELSKLVGWEQATGPAGSRPRPELSWTRL